MQNNKYKTIMCKYYSSCKPCPLGTRCHFAHGRDELRKITDDLPTNAPYIPNTKDQSQDENGDPKQQVGLHNYKTVTCKYWEQGKCKYQQNCSFAHGDCEMRNPENVPNRIGLNPIDPLKNTAVEYFLRHQQLMKISNELLVRYKGKIEIESIVNSGISALNGWKINQAAESLMKVVYNGDLAQDEREFNMKLIRESCAFAEKFLNFCQNEEFQKMFKYFQKHQTQVQNNMIFNQGMPLNRAN